MSAMAAQSVALRAMFAECPASSLYNKRMLGTSSSLLREDVNACIGDRGVEAND
jgi:hypothetical protein